MVGGWGWELADSPSSEERTLLLTFHFISLGILNHRRQVLKTEV